MEKWLAQYIGETPASIVNQILPIIIVIIVCLIVIKIIMRFVKRAIKKSKLEKGMHTFVEKAASIVLYFIAILIIADMMSIPITSLLAAFSVVGLAASLAIQDTLSNLASGVVVLMTHPFKTGDWVDVSNVSGTVKEVNFTHTILTTVDNKIIRVPNKDVVGATIVNYSESTNRRVCISFNVSYKNKTEKVLEIMNEVINATPNILRDKEIFTKVTEYKDSCIEYTLRVWTKNEDYWDVHFTLLNDVKVAFDKNGIEIPYNQLDVHVYNV